MCSMMRLYARAFSNTAEFRDLPLLIEVTDLVSVGLLLRTFMEDETVLVVSIECSLGGGNGRWIVDCLLVFYDGCALSHRLPLPTRTLYPGLTLFPLLEGMRSISLAGESQFVL